MGAGQLVRKLSNLLCFSFQAEPHLCSIVLSTDQLTLLVTLQPAPAPPHVPSPPGPHKPQRLQAAVANYMDLLVASRNLDFFTSFYRFLIQLLPAVVVAPLFFQGKIEFGVINQSQSAFNHVLSDMSLVVYQVGR